MRQVASDPQPHDGEEHPSRKAVDDAFQEYVKDHYATGVVTVYSHEGKVVVCVVGNKYNPRNYWNGRWRSQWTLDFSGNSCKCQG